MKTIWLMWGCGVFGAIYLIASAAYLISISKYGRQSTQKGLWLRNKNTLSPVGLDRLQLSIWRICLISRWIGGGLGGVFIVIEIVFLLMRGK